MAMHLTPEEHDADPPEGWTVRKCGRKWQLLNRNGGVLDTFDTKKRAEAEKIMGRAFRLYEAEGRWFKGEEVSPWRPYVECKPAMDKAAAAAAAARREMHKVIVNGVTMVHGPGHLTEAKSAEWVEIYRKINPNLPPGAIRTENTYWDAPEFKEGQRVHVNQDNEDWGRIAHDGTVRSVESTCLLVEIDGIRATVAVEFSEARLI